ncbi:MAG: hypothetical protein Q9182_004601 [Xanthomendoza sp. 2 TL-2023]
MPSVGDLAILRNNVSLSTWLLLGASIQSLVFAAVPYRVALLPSFCILMLVLAKNALVNFGFLRNPYLGAVFKGKWTATLQEDGEKGGEKVAVFLLDASSGPAIVTISYWKSIEHLHAFANGPAHRQGWNWWMAEARKQYPHLGIMHETYEAPYGRWENIYEGFVPIGMGDLSKKVVASDGSEKSEPRLVEAKSGRWSTMRGRLGEKDQ